MINPHSGEVSFHDGLRITAQAAIAEVLALLEIPEALWSDMQIEGWRHYGLGPHISDYGTFSVEATIDDTRRVAAVHLSHVHAFYEAATPEDSERHLFHESIVARDLFGQREFSWGWVYCRYDPRTLRDWLVVVYSPFAAVPLHERERLRMLREQYFPLSRPRPKPSGEPARRSNFFP